MSIKFGKSFMWRHERFTKNRTDKQPEVAVLLSVLGAELGWPDLLWRFVTSADRSIFVAIVDSMVYLVHRVDPNTISDTQFHTLVRSLHWRLRLRGLAAADPHISQKTLKGVQVYVAQLPLISDWRQQLWNA